MFFEYVGDHDPPQFSFLLSMNCHEKDSGVISSCRFRGLQFIVFFLLDWLLPLLKSPVSTAI